MDPTDRDANRRWFLKTLGVLGVTGLAGCGGDGDDGTDTATDTPTTTETATADTPTDTTTADTPTDTTTETVGGTDTPTETVGGTDTPAQPLGDPPEPLLSLGGASAGTGETTTLSGTLSNPYLFDVRNVSVSLSGPSGWDVSATGSTTFDRIESQSEQSVSWEVTVPEDASGANEFTATVEYESTTDSASVEVTSSISAYTPGDVPQEGLEAYFSLDTDTPVNAITGTEASVMGEPTSGATGIVGDAWEFETTGDPATVGDTVISEQLPINGEGSTVGAWLNFTDHEAYGRVYHVDAEGNAETPTSGWNVEFGETNDEAIVQYWNSGDTGRDSGDSISLSTGTWVFVVTVIDGGDYRIHAFDEDGELDASPVTGSGTYGQSDTAALIMMTGDGRDTAGRMDEVRAYSRALSADEVSRLYQGSIGQ